MKIFWVSLILLCALIAFFIATHGPIGSDSYAFIAYACGQPEWFEQFSTAWPYFPCGAFGIIGFAILATLIIVFSLQTILAKHTNLNLNCLILAIYGATPIFFLEALRFENDLMGYALGLLAIATFEIALEYRTSIYNNGKFFSNVIGFILSAIFFVLALMFWKASIILAIIPFALRYEKTNKTHKILAFLTLAGLGVFFYFFWHQIMLFGSGAGETMPLIGFIYLLPFIQFWKHIPKNLQPLTALFVCMGLIQFKFAYFAVPWLATGLINWIEQTNPFNKKLALGLLFGLIIGFALIMFPTQFPTEQDHKLAELAINYSDSNQVKLYWSWDYKWLMVAKNQPMQTSDTPDWNNYQRPFYAIIRADQPIQNCEIINQSQNGPLIYYLKYCN